MAASIAVAALPSPAAAQEDPPYVAWNPLLPSLATPFHPSRERDCSDGSPACIEQTLSDMYDRFDRLYSTCDHNAAFGITYIRVTEAIRPAIAGGFYEEPDFLHHEDRVFARMYFDSYDAWASGRREQVPPAWREAFDAGRDRNVNGIGNLLMSMNAHINRDFPFMLDALGLTMPDGRSRKPDHDRGNEILNTLYDDVLRELAERFDPVVDDANVPGLTADDATVFQILQSWREDVWRNAERLAAAETLGQRAAVAESIEQYALANARQIRAATTISDSSPRDAHCAAYRATHRETGGLARVVDSMRRSRVRVSCPGPIRECIARVVAVRGGRVLGRAAPFVIEPGQSRVVALRRTRLGRRVITRVDWSRGRGRRRTTRVRRYVKRLPSPRVQMVTYSPSPWGTTRTTVVPGRLKR